LRVIAGIAKKRRLKSPGKLPVRPTSDRVKESLFNIISGLVPGCSFADLYAGTGGVGIEALSREAREVVFVENNAQVAGILRENIKLTGLQANAEVIQRDVEAACRLLLGKRCIFDIIFADPPYRQGLANEVLNILNKYPLLQVNGLLIIETGGDEKVPEKKGSLLLVRREKYGDTTIIFYKPVAEGDML